VEFKPTIPVFERRASDFPAIRTGLFIKYYSIKVIKSRMGHIARMGKMRNAYRIVAGNPEEKKPLGKLWRGWKLPSNTGCWPSITAECKN
jgi:hypothetical protein